MPGRALTKAPPMKKAAAGTAPTAQWSRIADTRDLLEEILRHLVPAPRDIVMAGASCTVPSRRSGPVKTSNIMYFRYSCSDPLRKYFLKSRREVTIKIISIVTIDVSRALLSHRPGPFYI